MGMQPGPRFKEILDEAQTEQLEGRITTREQGLKFISKLPKTGGMSPG